MDKNATKYKSVDEYDDPAVEKEASESTPTEQTDIEQAEMNMDASVTNSNGPDNMSFQTEVSGSSASEQKCVETTYLHQQGSFQLPPYEAAINTIQSIQENHSGGGRRKKNKNENIRLTETSYKGRSFQPTHLERRTYEERKDSFLSCSDLHKLPQAVALAEAGFYFADNGVIQCFACGIEFRDWTEQDNIWEWHARCSISCSHVETEGKKYFDLQYLDLKNKKKQAFRDHREQLKKWLLCKLCHVNISNLVLLPCGHVCLCIECAGKVTVCPTCDSHIWQHVQASLDV